MNLLVAAALSCAGTAAAVSGCKPKSPPPPAPETPGTTRIVIRDPQGAATATFAPIGGGEWEVTPADRSPFFVRVKGVELRAVDATGETLARLSPVPDKPDAWTLFDANDSVVATVARFGRDGLELTEKPGQKPPGLAGTPGYTLDYTGGTPPLALIGIATDTSTPLEQRALLVALSLKSR